MIFWKDRKVKKNAILKKKVLSVTYKCKTVYKPCVNSQGYTSQSN